MINKFVFTVLVALIACSASFAEEVTLPKTLKAGDTELILNGSGIREKKIAFINVDLYVGGLYLTKKGSDAAKIINADEAMAIKLHIVSRLITPKRMSEMLNTGFENSTNGNTAPIKKEISKMISVFSDGINVDDVYDMIYIPGDGFHIMKNEKKGILVKGLDFKKALVGIWFCNQPPQESLKKKMLGL